MKILGFIKENSSILAISGITLVSCIALLTQPRTESTLVESMSFQDESLDLTVRTKEGGELNLRVTGRNTTEVVQNLKPILRGLASSILPEKSSHSIQLVEG